MKKTMFITSVIMVVVLAIALTTSSLAWFSAGGQSSVGTSNITLQATTAPSAAGIQIALNNTDYSSYGNSVTFPNTVTASNLNPAAVIFPTGSTMADLDNDDLIAALQNTVAFNNDSFSTGFESGRTYQGYFRQLEAAVVFQNETLYVGNNGNESATVSCSVSFIDATSGNAYSVGASGDPLLWVAVIAAIPGDGNTTEYKLVALQNSAGSEDTRGIACFNGKLAANADATTENPGGATSASSVIINKLFTAESFTLAAGTTHETEGTLIVDTTKSAQIFTYAWFDGASLSNDNAGRSIKIALTFSI